MQGCRALLRTAYQAPRQRTGGRTLSIGDFSGHDRGHIAGGSLADPRAAVRQIGHQFRTPDSDPLDVDDVDVAAKPWRYHAAIVEPDCGGGLGGQALDHPLDRYAAGSRVRPALEHEGSQARIANETAMGAAIAESEQRILVREHRLDCAGAVARIVDGREI